MVRALAHNLPRISETDPSGTLRAEKQAAAMAEKILKRAVAEATAYVKVIGITNPIEIDRIVAAYLTQAERELEALGIRIVQTGQVTAILRTNNILNRMGDAITLNIAQVPQSLTLQAQVSVLNDVVSLSMDTKKNVSRVLAEAMSEGLGSAQIAKRVSEATETDIKKARTIARSTMNKVYNDTAKEGYKRAGVIGYCIYPTRDERLCPKCKEAAYVESSSTLKVYPPDEVPSLPIHPNCRCSIIGYWDDSEPIVAKRPKEAEA